MGATERQALIVVDMLNPYEHEDAEQLTPQRRATWSTRSATWSAAPRTRAST